MCPRSDDAHATAMNDETQRSGTDLEKGITMVNSDRLELSRTAKSLGRTTSVELTLNS